MTSNALKQPACSDDSEQSDGTLLSHFRFFYLEKVVKFPDFGGAVSSLTENNVQMEVRCLVHVLINN